MTPNVAMPTPSAPKPAGAARAATGHDAAHAAAPAGQERFGHQFDHAMKQQQGEGAVAAETAPPLMLPKAALPSTETGQALAGNDGDTSTDPAERDGNVLAAAVLALLGQGVAAPANAVVAAAKGQSVSLDAGKGGTPHGGAAALLAAAKGGEAAPAPATAPSAGVDAGALLAIATQPTALETRKSEPPTMIDALAAPMAPHAAGSGAPTAAHALKMDAPAGSPAFAEELGQQVAWLGGQEIKQARIRLRPEELGQLDVKVSVAEHGRVDVSFTAQHPSAVTAVQQTLGQLDLMLAGQGLSLGQAQVGQHGRQGDGHAQGAQASAVFGDEAEASELAVQRVAVGLLDTFA